MTNRKTTLFRIIGIVVAAAGLIFLPILIEERTLSFSTNTGITYQLDWVWGKAGPPENGQGWTVINDLDYRISIERGYLVTGSVQLVPCPKNVQGRAASWVTDRLLPHPLYAGHGGERDESKSTIPYVESLTRPGPVELETVSVPQGALYCQAHYLVAYGVETAKNLPSEPDMIGTSLFVEGVYRSPGNSLEQPFSIQTNLAWGTITDLIPAAGPAAHLSLKIGPSPLRVTLRRNLGVLFDGVDFDHMTETEQAKAILRSLTDQTQVFVEVE